ncbi:hypothetical protein [Propionivibrio sp.]|uniref:hypothetical protein n=1 Tax=Propionivibrio sp. TaxID=2212460 RepID=UPI003BF24003
MNKKATQKKSKPEKLTYRDPYAWNAVAKKMRGEWTPEDEVIEEARIAAHKAEFKKLQAEQKAKPKRKI